MGLKNFLKQQGFIEDGPSDKKKGKENSQASSKQPDADVSPVYFPANFNNDTGSPTTSAGEPSFVTPLQQSGNTVLTKLDPSFIKFFEDELVKANLPGPDYFEFRQLLLKTQQKMTTKGGAAPEVVLQAVLLSFEAQDISRAKLVDAARKYKDILKQRNDDFLSGAAKEKNKQLQKREDALRGHNENIQQFQQQIQQLELQKQQLQESLNKERTQLEVDKSLGQEGIQKIEKAETLISLAHDYIQSTIDTDIKRLQAE